MLGQGDEGLLGWVFAGVATVIATLAGAVATLFRTNQTQVQAAHTEQINQLKKGYENLRDRYTNLDMESKKCLKDREELRVEIAGIKARMGICESELHDTRRENTDPRSD